MSNDSTDEAAAASGDFIRTMIGEDRRQGRFGGRVVTRFPPEPNGYLHIGHTKAICLNFAVAKEMGGTCHLRFDDTNPSAEEVEYVDSIKNDIRWLGFDWGENLFFASDYFGQLYDYAVDLIRRGKAYVCDLSSEEHRQHRGTLTEPGIDSPYRGRSVEENLDLFERMKQGEFETGSRVVRAKIDMASPILTMRDPILFRIQKGVHHHRTGAEWHIYPMYDFAHCLSDSIENITHSLCTLEFLDHRPLYDWILDELELESHPQQIEFARLNLSHTVMSKRILRGMVERGLVSGWDDPRMPTLSGMRRRGYPPQAIRSFCEGVGVTKKNNTIQLARLEFNVREHWNRHAPRKMAVLDPLPVVITNYPDGQVEEIEAINNPEDPSAGTRSVPFSRVLFIERGDFREDPPRKFFRLAPGREVRLRYAYFITCDEVVKNADGEIVELRCRYDPATHGGDAPDGRKVKATLHWVSAEYSVRADVRVYEPLFSAEDPLDVPEGEDFTASLNPDSIRVLSDCRVEPGLVGASVGDTVQFERQGYFTVDPDSTPDALVFNRAVTLRDTWAKVAKKG